MKNLSKQYAYALFELSEEQNIENIILTDFKLVSNIIKDNPKYLDILSSYTIASKEKTELLTTALRNHINGYLLSFLKVLVKNQHASLIYSCFDEYRVLYNEKYHLLNATAYTCIPMTNSQLEKLSLKLQTATKKQINLSNKIDTSIIAGIRVVYETSSIDITLKNYFKKLSNNLHLNSKSIL